MFKIAKRKNIGIVLLCLGVFATLSLYLLAKIYNNTLEFTPILLFLSQIAANLSIMFLGLSFLLSSKHAIISDLFGGLDDLLYWHKRVSKWALYLILIHPIGLTLNSFLNSGSLTLYLFPGNIDYYNFGIYAVYIFLILILISIFRFLPYNIWKFSHLFLGIPFLLAGLHSINSNGDASQFAPLHIWNTFWIFVGLLSYVYSLIIYRFFLKYNYFVSGIEFMSDDITKIILETNGKPLKFVAGQFAFFSVRTNKNISKELHPYSIANSSFENHIEIFIKNLGDHSAKMRELKIGDRVWVYGPHGEFNSKFYLPVCSTEIWIAGGIGITPFLGLLKEYILNRCSKEIIFYSCARTKQEQYFESYIQNLISVHSLNIKLICRNDSEDGYLNVEHIQKELGSKLLESRFFICGPKPMMRSLQKQLTEKHVCLDCITMEDFSFA